MTPALAVDRSIIAISHDEVVHLLIELAAPAAAGEGTPAAQGLVATIAPNEHIASMHVFSDRPTTFHTDGTLSVDLGDLGANETRQLVAEIGLLPQHRHGPIDVATVGVRWTTPPDAAATHSVLMPVVVTVGEPDGVVDATADARVVEQVAVLKAAAEERQARDSVDRGDVDGAQRLLRSGATRLRYVGRNGDAERLETLADRIGREGTTAGGRPLGR